MDTVASRLDTTADLQRGGFWRRWLATLIDAIIVILPFQAFAAVLFAITAGTVQMESGFYRYCAATTTLPQSLAPPPPRDSNFARVCRTSFFGAPTGVVLIVGRTVRDGNVTTTVSQGYMLDKGGRPIDGINIDSIVSLAFLIYLVGMVWKSGKTVGARTVGVRVIDTANPNALEVSLRKVIIRYLAMVIGVVPIFAALIYQYVTTGGTADAIFTASFFIWMMCTGAVAVLWLVVLIVQVAMKRDPVYDRVAGTAVVRD
jgi:uncharacterized RDD family membrane protein YckC